MAERETRTYGRGAQKAKRFAFRCDTAALRHWLGKRKASMEAVRRHYEPLWREIREYFEPNVGKALVAGSDRDGTMAKREDGKILNSEPRLCVHRYAAGMQSGITNKAQAWCTIVPKGLDEEECRDPELNEWCNTATSKTLEALERANFYRTSCQVYAHGALMGTSCVMILRNAGMPGEVFFKLVDEGDYWLAEDCYGDANVLMRRIPMTIGQAAEEFLAERMPEAWRQKAEDGRLEERVEVWNLICPNDGSEKFKDVAPGRRWVSVYWTGEAGASEYDGILDVASFGYKPFAALRQMDGWGAYGKGLGEMSLPDNKMLQKLEEYHAKMAIMETDPPMLAPSSMKGKPINMFPGGVTYYDGVMGTGANPVQRLYETRPDITAVGQKIQTVTERIGRIWYNDLFAMMLQVNAANRGQKTATEVAELSGEKVTLLGPVLTQMDEFLTGIVDATLSILYEDGIIPEAPAALAQGDADISVEYTSTIHAEMKAALKMRAINMTIEMASMLAQAKPETLDKIDADKIVDETCRVYPGAAAFIKTSREVQKIRAAREQMQQQQMQQAQYAEMMKNAGSNVRDLSEARLGNGSALDAVMAAAGGAA